MTDPLVSLENLTVQFDSRPVVDRVNLKIHRGDIITIIGPNGAGKTTLIKAVLGIQKVSAGQVSVKKNLVIGYVPQHLTLEATLPLSVKRFMLLSGRSVNASPLWPEPVSATLCMHPSIICPVVKNSDFCWPGPSPADRIFWFWMNRLKASISTARRHCMT